MTDLAKYKKPETTSAVDLSKYKKAPSEESGFLGTKKDDSMYGKVLDNSISRGIQRFFPGAQIGKAIGTLGGLGAVAIKEKLGAAPQGVTEAYDISAPSPLQTVGDAVLAGASVAGLKVPLPTATTPLRTVFQGAKTGAALGALGGGGAAATQTSGQLTPTLDDLKTVASGATVGGLLGGALGAVTTPLANRATPQSRQTLTIQKRFNSLSNVEKNNAVVRRALAQADSKGIDARRLLSETDLLNGAVDRNGTVSTKAAMENFKEFVRPFEGQVRSVLEREATVVPLKSIQSRLEQGLTQSGIKGGARLTLSNAINDEIRGLAMSADDAGNIPLVAIHDSKVFRMANQNYADPGANAVGKEVARILKEIVEENTNSMNVKAYNTELSKLYGLRDVLKALDGKKVEGGRLGKHFSTLLGAGVGSHFGPLGAIAGAEVGSAVKGMQLNRAFGGALKNTLSNKEKLNLQIRSIPDEIQSRSLGNRQTIQAPTTATTNNVIQRTVSQPQPKSRSVMHPEDQTFLSDFSFMDRPDAKTIQHARETFESYGFIAPKDTKAFQRHLRDAQESTFDKSIR